MPKSLAKQGIALAAMCALGALLGCAEATPAWGPTSPRNGAGQPVDLVYGTPIPGYTMLPK